MTELQHKQAYKTQLLNVIRLKEDELQDLKQTLKTVNDDIFNINEGKQREFKL